MRLIKILLKKAPTQLFSCEHCKIFKNNYFEEHPRTAASEVRINPKWNLRKQVFFKTDVLKYSLKATEWHLYWSVFLRKLQFWNHEHERVKVMNVLHKLILSTSKMAEVAKQDVHMWKETVLFYLIIVLQEGNLARFELFSKIL